MIWRAAILLGVPVVAVAAVAGPVGFVAGPYQWLCAAVATALVVPPGVVTLLVAERLAKVSVVGPLMALVVGTAIRLAVGYGGAVLVFFLARPTFHADPLSYFAWVLGLYLTTLIVETILLAQGTGAAPQPPKS